MDSRVVCEDIARIDVRDLHAVDRRELSLRSSPPILLDQLAATHWRPFAPAMTYARWQM
jgi:hypothetical protein